MWRYFYQDLQYCNFTVGVCKTYPLQKSLNTNTLQNCQHTHIIQVSCYTLLSRLQLPCPLSWCLYTCTTFNTTSGLKIIIIIAIASSAYQNKPSKVCLHFQSLIDHSLYNTKRENPPVLQETSGETRYMMVRLVFRHYTQIERTICTSIALQASTTC